MDFFMTMANAILLLVAFSQNQNGYTTLVLSVIKDPAWILCKCSILWLVLTMTQPFNHSKNVCTNFPEKTPEISRPGILKLQK